MYSYYNNNQTPFMYMPPVMNSGLKGKTIDNLEVVKGADILWMEVYLIFQWQMEVQ